MIRKSFVILMMAALFAGNVARADEGMWIPILIEKYNIKLMQEKGFKLTAEDIYSVNQASMKDAIVIFGGGCTGEVISGEGLLITNHHCGYSRIQSHSSLEHDYLTNGFWAMSKEEELPNPRLSVTFLKWMADVTDKVLEGVREGMSEEERERIIGENSARIRREAIEGTHYTASVRPFYMGNQYFLFVNEVFRDVRLVGAPPSAIGKFGGETDNWVWPRHTGDFSLFRIYSHKDGKPADYSKDNVPYKPGHFFPISLKGVQEGDFTMVFGYPGSTIQYVPSYHIDMVKNHLNPKMIELRGKKIEIYEDEMAKDALVRIQYSSKKSDVANSWKKWIGELQGLERLKTIEKKKEYEARFQTWATSNPSLKAKYGNLLPRYSELYGELVRYNVVNNFTNEVFFSSGIEALAQSRSYRSLIALASSDASPDQLKTAAGNAASSAEGFFKNYDVRVDRRIAVAMLELYSRIIPVENQAPEFIKLNQKYKGNFSVAVEDMYSKTVFADQAKLNAFLANFSKGSAKKLAKDPLYILAVDVDNYLATNYRGEVSRINSEITRLNKVYMAAQMEFEPERRFYPDANSTLRVTYGEVKGYDSRDAVYHQHYTTLKGIMEKDNPNIYDYDVPQKLRDLYAARDFGRYTQDGEVPVCFIATNHTTGGNSGSPVINAEGHLIGVNFDRAWEGVASDMAFNPEQSRNISLDIRYALFIIDKLAGAGYLLDEMILVDK
ncbi:MAG: S46 family peptidase [Bacteroidales bacterium]|nr:S46 family peptidase [Bacteroidales bacterium]